MPIAGGTNLSAQTYTVVSPSPAPTAASPNREVILLSTVARTREGALPGVAPVNLGGTAGTPTSSVVTGSTFADRSHAITLPGGDVATEVIWLSPTPAPAICPSAGFRMDAAPETGGAVAFRQFTRGYVRKNPGTGLPDLGNLVRAIYTPEAKGWLIQYVIDGVATLALIGPPTEAEPGGTAFLPQSTYAGTLGGDPLLGWSLSLVPVIDAVNLFMVSPQGVQHWIASVVIPGWLTTAGTHVGFDVPGEHENYFPFYGVGYQGANPASFTLSRVEHGVCGGVAERETFPVTTKSDDPARNGAPYIADYEGAPHLFYFVDRPMPHPSTTFEGIIYCGQFVEADPLADLQAKVKPNRKQVKLLQFDRPTRAGFGAENRIHLDQDGEGIVDLAAGMVDGVGNTWGDIGGVRKTETVNVQHFRFPLSELTTPGVLTLTAGEHGLRLLDAAIAVDPDAPAAGARGQYDTSRRYCSAAELASLGLDALGLTTPRWLRIDTITDQPFTATPDPWYWGPRLSWSFDQVTWTEVWRRIGTDYETSYEGTCFNQVNGKLNLCAFRHGADAGQDWVNLFDPITGAPTPIPVAQIPNPKLAEGGQGTTSHFRIAAFPTPSGGTGWIGNGFNDRQHKRINGVGAAWLAGDVHVLYATQNATGAEFNHGLDQTAPTLTLPVGAATGQTTATVGATTNENDGTLYGVVTASATPPTGAQVKAGQGANGAAAAFAGSVAVSSTGAKTIAATGLTASTAYYAHLCHEDASGNRSAVVTSAQFTTQAAPGGGGGPVTLSEESIEALADALAARLLSNPAVPLANDAQGRVAASNVRVTVVRDSN